MPMMHTLPQRTIAIARLSPARRIGIYAVGTSLWASGALWLVFHYFMMRQEEFGPSPHPLEAWLLRLHGASIFGAIWTFGFLWGVHIVHGWNMRRHRWSGGIMVAWVGWLMLTGYLLYYLGDEDLRDLTAPLHWIVGLGVPLPFLTHRFAGKIARRRAGTKTSTATAASGGQSWANTIGVTVRKITPLADGIIGVELVGADGGMLPPFAAGAHVDLHIGPDLVRQYSLCGDPADHSRYRLGILRHRDSRGGSAKIFETLRAGQAIRIGHPRNHFPLDETARRTILVAGGIGITPILSMAYRLEAIGAAFELVYCTRSRSTAAFLDELQAAPFAAKVKIHHDEEPKLWFTSEGWLAGADEGSHLYVCGPAGFINYVDSAARTIGWSADNIHVEHFAATANTLGPRFTVRAERSALSIDIPPDTTIAAALLANGIPVPLSCEQGVCGTCRIPVLSGEPDHRDLYQTEREKAGNTHIAVCCSRAKSALLVLDI